MTITAHVMVKNEYQFIWYSVMSIINHVDKVLIWDTGSIDGTQDIIKEILKTDQGKKKVIFKNEPVTPFDEEVLRQKMLDLTTSDWFLVVDGDEIWWEDSIKAVVASIQRDGHHSESLVIPTINTVGDIYHYQEKNAGNYHLAGRVGHYNLRGINRLIPGLHSEGPHGVWGWADGEGKQIQERALNKILYVDAPYLHCTFLDRTTSRAFDAQVLKRVHKRKHEIGISFPNNYYYPEVFFRSRPTNVPSVWKVMANSFKTRAYIETPLRKVKRTYLPKKIGY